MASRKQSHVEFIPLFQKSFLLPRYWGIWLGITILATITLIPARLRDPVLGSFGRIAGRFAPNARRRALINLLYCLPEKSELERKRIVDSMFSTMLQSTAMMVELALRPNTVKTRIHWHRRDILDELRDSRQNVILLVPHSWAVDLPVMLLAAEGQRMAAMFHHQSNLFIDYIWNLVRYKCGTRMHARNDGILPFIKSIRQGYWGYYLPDQDHGERHSEFADFFSTYKATLPIMGRMMRVCRAKIVPLFPVYNSKTHSLDIYLRAPFIENDFSSDSVKQARRLNAEVEVFVRPNPEQYTWILKLLKTRRPGDQEPYARRELYPIKDKNHAFIERRF
ncbi:lauroyl-Kdo(2)-lipid IV(A) myristoyltransferase [Candidatus Erwinia haradaeae]|uniref:Lipid A biosynthesis acyltransferase n=1 Tax=Candidatus Erwinia haradaeae TaxID=1922217 RepID=A0A451D289_9GAMM|nr:lauroyl-Kdo(2)-lipid IV(A) myristoyltransferase [Candidatus Erwinia haradaeae]VFP79751.1 Lipid A biosynthesis myristoyltransferase [Candidatus Erwinia haradaeae]